MSREDELYRKINTWLDQRDEFTSQLRELAKELESVNEKCNAGRAVGNSVTILGGAALVGAGVATWLSAGMASPLLAVAAGYGAVGSTVTLTSKLIEMWLERGTLKKAEAVSQKNKRVGEEIQACFQNLVRENTSGSDLASSDDIVVECILRAIAKKLNIGWMEVVSWIKSTQVVWAPLIAKLSQQVLPQTGSQIGMEERLTRFIRNQARNFVTDATFQALKTFGKGAVQVGGGVFTVAMTLPGTIDNYERAIKNNNVTEPSKELRDAAAEIEVTTRGIREILEDIENRMRTFARRNGR